MYLVKHRNKYTTTLLQHLFNGKYIEFGDSTFIDVKNDNNSELFNMKIVTTQFRDKIVEYMKQHICMEQTYLY